MLRRLLPLLLFVAPAYAQQPCDTAAETRQLRETLREVVRVQVLTEQLRWEHTRIATLREERRTHATAVEAVEMRMFGEEDLAQFDKTNPAQAARAREQQPSAEAELADARRKVAAIDASIAAAEKRVEVLLKQLHEIAARLDQPAKPAPDVSRPE